MGFCAQRDWIITHSRHAKSFSRFLLDTDGPIFSTQSPEGPDTSNPVLPLLSNKKNQQNSSTLLLSRLKFTEFRAFSHQLTVVETKPWVNCQDFLQKLNPYPSRIKKEIKIQRRQILHSHWGLLALENAANVTGSPCRNIISKNPNSIYAVSHLKYIFWHGTKDCFCF